MNSTLRKSMLAAALALPMTSLLIGVSAYANDETVKLAAVEALMAAPPEKAVPILTNVLKGNGSDELKSRALFVLTQTDAPQVEEVLLAYAEDSEGSLQTEAIRMIGIHGDDALLDELMPLYRAGDEEVRKSVLSAFHIADRPESVLQIAKEAETDDEFEAAVTMLGAMEATSMLAELKDHSKASAGLVQAYAVAGDSESLLAMARDDSDRDRQLQAIQGLGIAGGDDVGGHLVEIYQGSTDPAIKEAALQGLQIAGDDQALLTLYQSSTDSEEKAELLKQLVMTDSDLALEAINAALEESR